MKVWGNGKAVTWRASGALIYVRRTEGETTQVETGQNDRMPTGEGCSDSDGHS